MGAACGCSRTNDNIKEVVALTTPAVTTLQSGEADLATYQRKNAKQMHNKVQALYTSALTQPVPGLSDIKLSACKTKDKDWEHLFHLFTYSVHIQRLVLWKVTISQGSFAQLSRHLAVMTELESLMLGDMGLSSLEIDSLAEGLKGLGKLKELFLTVNNLKIEQFKVLFPALQTLKYLQVLSLDENYLGDTGAQLIAELLRVLTRVSEVSLKFNIINSAGLKALLPWVRRRPGLVVRLEGNDLSDEEYDELEQAHLEAVA